MAAAVEVAGYWPGCGDGFGSGAGFGCGSGLGVGRRRASMGGRPRVRSWGPVSRPLVVVRR